MPLSHEEARNFYDHFGSKEDWQRIYEDKAVADLVKHGQFDQARSVFEFGCGTGWLAKELLERHMPPTSRYTAIDVSATMIDLTTKRLASFGERAQVMLSDGEMRVEQADEKYDRFLITYVLDLLSDSDRSALLAEAYRVLQPCGLLALVSLAHGEKIFSRAIETAWVGLYSVRPRLVGGCRPVELLSLLDPAKWQLIHHAHIEQLALASECIVAVKAPA